MANYKVPSQASSGAQTFNDNLVGVQITDGTSQLTNTNFAIDKVIPQKDSKTFKSNPFSVFLTLDDLNQETNAPTTQSEEDIKKTIKFKGSKNDAGKSLFGSLKSRLIVSITRIINKFPGAVYVNGQGPISASLNTASNIVYDINEKTTQFEIEVSMFYNPFDIIFTIPKSNVLVKSDNEIRKFYSSYKKYVLDLNKNTYNIINYTEPNSENKIILKVNGNPFSGNTTYTLNYLIRPNNGITEEFFNGLDDVEEVLLNRDTNPKYTANFKVPRDSFDSEKTDIVTIQYSWPLSNDGWNIQTVGLDYESYVRDLSNISVEIDDYKSNLMVRFLASPQLFEFDSDDKKIESIFQLYGQSFDSVKKFIDNIAYMRNVSYDGVNNLPDILLKNLANTLGLESINLFDEKQIDQLLYSRTDVQYSGLTMGYTLIDAEYEFYRRLLVNLAYIYKSKGTKSSMQFFLKFLGAPEPMIKINEYVYKVTSFPKSFDIQKDIYDVIQGVKINTTATFDISTYTYSKTTTTGSTSFTRDGYPVDEITGFPRRAYDTTSDIFFQKGAGWYDNTLNHRSVSILDTENSILTGRTKTILTKSKDYTYGEDYFDVFRTLPGLDTGFEIVSEIANKESSVDNNNLGLTLNRKNISIFLSSSQAVDYDIYRKSRDLMLTFGSNSLEPQTGVTFAEYVDLILHEQIKNSHIIKYKKNYITLEDIFKSYMSTIGFTPYNYLNVNEFINKMSPYWTQVIEQIIPSTTLWSGGNIIENNIFGRSKYGYKFGCQPKEMVETVYLLPTFLTQGLIDLFVTWLGSQPPDQPLERLEFHPIIEMDGVNYSGSTSISFATISGMTGTTYSVPLYKNEYLYEIFDDDFLALNLELLNTIWRTSIINLLDEVINKTTLIDPPGVISNYSPYTAATSGETHTQVYQKSLTYKFFIDNDGIEKIKITSVKFGPHSCSVMESFTFNCLLKIFRIDAPETCRIMNEDGLFIMSENDVSSYPFIVRENCVVPITIPTLTPLGCSGWKIDNNTNTTITWSGNLCGSGTLTNGSVSGYNVTNTTWIVDGTLSYSGTPNITLNGIC